MELSGRFIMASVLPLSRSSLHATASPTHLARISRIRQGGAAGLPVDLHGKAVVPEGDHHSDATCCSARRRHLLRVRRPEPGPELDVKTGLILGSSYLWFLLIEQLALRQLARALVDKAKAICAEHGTVIKVGYRKGTICEAVEKLNVDPFILGSHNHVRSCKACGSGAYTLTDSQYNEFEDMLRALTLERSQIKEAMDLR